MIFVLQALKEPKYFGLAVFFAFFIWFLYPFLQVLLQGLNNFWFWFTLLTPLGWFLYLFYGILFGATLSFFIWQRAKKICPVSRTVRGGVFGVIGGFLGTVTPLCPACLSWVILFLPVSLVPSLLKYNVEIMGLSVILLFLALWTLGGFKKA